MNYEIFMGCVFLIKKSILGVHTYQSSLFFFFFPPEANYDRKTVMNAMTKPGGKKYFCGTASDLLFFLCSFQLVTRPGAVNKSRLLAKNITCHPDLNNA